MPKRTDIRKVLVIGSGPIVIGQAAEFDYAGTQACLALKEEGCEVILVNSNPATIMTDHAIADKVYMEPLTLEYLAKICRYERSNFWEQMRTASAARRTGNFLKRFVKNLGNQLYRPGPPGAWRKVWPWQSGSAIPLSCGRHLPSVEPEADSRTMRPRCLKK